MVRNTSKHTNQTAESQFTTRYDTHNVAVSFVSSALLNAVCVAAKPLNVVTGEWEHCTGHLA